MSAGCPSWLCPQHRDSIRRGPEAAVQLWRLLHSSPELADGSNVRMQLACWHVALEIVDALLEWRWPDSHGCLLAAAVELVPGTLDDGWLLLRLHELLTRAVQGNHLPACPKLAVWLELLEQRFLLGPSAALPFPGTEMGWH